MSYWQISAALATVQGHAEHSRRAGLMPGLIFAFRGEQGDWHPAEPDVILPDGPYAAGDSITIRPAEMPCSPITQVAALSHAEMDVLYPATREAQLPGRRPDLPMCVRGA